MPYLSAAARRLAQAEGLGNVEFRTGDSHSLGLADAAYDAVVAHTLLSHVEDERAVLKEIVRVVRPGGKVGIFDGDYASMTLAVDEPAKAKAMDELIISAQVTNPRIMREMPAAASGGRAGAESRRLRTSSPTSARRISSRRRFRP